MSAQTLLSLFFYRISNVAIADNNFSSEPRPINLLSYYSLNPYSSANKNSIMSYYYGVLESLFRSC
jgi:hypothetical protein